jgi:two-component system alkaline phosphatase synthesis response regulator PhoP
VSPHVLVIDDSELMREAAKLGLERAGWTTTLAADGSEGLRLAADDPPAAVLLDLSMPGVDGLEVLRRLRETPQTVTVPVILLTASPEDAAGHGADGIIAKPFPPLELAGLVRSQLGWRA